MFGLKQVCFAAAYIAGLVILVTLSPDWIGEDRLFYVVVAGWSLMFGLMTTRVEALLVPGTLVNAAFVVGAIWLAATDGLIGEDSGPSSILIWPMIAGAALLATAAPMGVGIAIRRLLGQP